MVTSPSNSDLAFAAILLGVNALVGYVANYVHLMTLSRVGQNLLLGLRTAIFNHFQRLSISFFDRTEVGSNMSRVQNDVQQLQEFLAIFVLSLGDLLTLGGIIVAMLLMDTQLALITLAVIPVLFGIMVVWQRYAWRSFMRVRRDMAAVNSGLQENISGVRVIQSLNRQDVNLRDFDASSQRYADSSLKASRLSSALNPSVEFTTAVATALVIVFGGRMVLSGEMEVGILVAFALYINRFFDPIRSLTMQYGQLQRAMTSGQHIFEILDVEPQIVDRPGAANLADLRGEISLENVSFSYTQGVEVLKDVNLRIMPGEKIALVGPTGAGKTTLAALVSRLYDVTEGRITVDGHDLRDVARVSLNRQTSVVPQEPFLFSGTIRDNIRYSHTDASDEDISRVARVVGAHDFIMHLEAGYDTQVEERGGEPQSRPAADHLAGAGPRGRSTNRRAGRGYGHCGQPYRDAHSAGAEPGAAGAHSPHHSPQALHGPRRRPHSGDGQWTHSGGGYPPGSRGGRGPVRQTVRAEQAGVTLTSQRYKQSCAL